MAGSRVRGGRTCLRALAAGAVVLLGVTLTGCAAAPAAPRGTPARTASAEPPVATSVPGPALAPELSASDNLGYFDTVIEALLTGNPGADGRAFVDALAAGGFDKTSMEVGFDRTHVDLAADSVQFSVRFHGACLIGQNGPASGGFHSQVAPLLGTGTCLVGVTRQIDW